MKMGYRGGNRRGGRGASHNKGRHNGPVNNTPYHRDNSQSEPQVSVEESLQARLSLLILKIGDKRSSSLEKNIDTLAKVLVKDYSKYSETINENLLICITEFPFKTNIYGCLVSLVLARDQEIGMDLLSFIFKDFEKDLASGNWMSAKILLRFFGELVNARVISVSSFLSIYNGLLDSLTPPISKDQGDCYVQLILGSLPWVAKTIFTIDPEQLNLLLERVENYFTLRNSISDDRITILKSFPLMASEEQDFLELLFSQTKECQERDWEVNELLKPFKAFEEILSLAKQQDLPSFHSPDSSTSLDYSPPHMQFYLFPFHEQVLNTMGYYILSDIINDTIDIFHTNRRECVRFVFSFDEFFPENTFTILNSKPDSLKKPEPPSSNNGDEASAMETEESKSLPDNSNVTGIDLFYLITESIFRKLFQLPKSPHKGTYYGSLIFEAFKTFPKRFPAILREAVEIIFSKAKDMDVECVERFYNWFSQHLSNFDFKWEWNNWESVLELDNFDNQRIICKETINKLIRLSYYDRIKTTIPESFAPLIPDRSPEPLFSFSAPEDDAPYKLFCVSILDAYKLKQNPLQIISLIKEANEELEDENLVRKIAVETLLLLGSKSISHMMNIIERFLSVLQHLAAEKEDKIEIIKISATFWRENPQWLGIQLDKFLNYNIIEPINVVDWAFDSDNLDSINSSFFWEIVYNTINKLIIWVDQQKVNYEASLFAKDDLKQSTLLEAVNNSQMDLKNYCIAVFQHLVHIISEHISKLVSLNENPEENNQYIYLIGRFKEFGRKYQNIVSNNIVSIESIVFNSSIDERLLQAFEEIKSLKTPPVLSAI